eukprot:UN26372
MRCALWYDIPEIPSPLQLCNLEILIYNFHAGSGWILGYPITTADATGSWPWDCHVKNRDYWVAPVDCSGTLSCDQATCLQVYTVVTAQEGEGNPCDRTGEGDECAADNNCVKCGTHSDCNACLTQGEVAPQCYWKDEVCSVNNEENSVIEIGGCPDIDCPAYPDCTSCDAAPEVQGCAWRGEFGCSNVDDFEFMGNGVCTSTSNWQVDAGTAPNYSKNFSNETVCRQDCEAWSGSDWTGPQCMGYSF